MSTESARTTKGARVLCRLAASIVLASTAAIALPVSVQGAFPGRNGMIAVDSQHGLELIDPVSGYRTIIGANGHQLAWSPDGRRIAFVDGTFGDDIYVMNADGTGRRLVRALPGNQNRPAWSPDGTQLAFETDQLEGGGVAVMAADGSGEARLVIPGAQAPSWSPDGRRLAFTLAEPDEDFGARIWTNLLDGTDRRLAVDLSDDAIGHWPTEPDWSPGGHELLYHWEARSSVCGVCNELYHSSWDGGGRTGSPLGPVNVLESAWSPQGDQVVTTDPDGVYTLRLRDRSRRTVISEPGGYFTSAGWQPLENLVPNPSFEFGLAGWSAAGGSLSRALGDDAPDGIAAARAARAGSAASYSVEGGDGAPTTAGTGYVATAYVKAASGSAVGKPVTLQLRERTPGGTVVRESASVAATLGGTFKRLSVTAAASASGNRLAILIRQAGATAGDAMLVDLVTLARTRQTMGAEAPGDVWTLSGAGYKRASRFEQLRPADVVRLRVYLDGKGTTGTGSQAVRGLVYADAGMEPGSRIATTSEVKISAGRSAGWIELPFPSAVGLRAGHYWLGLHTGPTGNIVRYAAASRTSALRWHTDPYGDGASDPFGTADVDNKELSIQAVGG